jgi:ATP-dependent RNA helicase DBP3
VTLKPYLALNIHDMAKRLPEESVNPTVGVDVPPKKKRRAEKSPDVDDQVSQKSSDKKARKEKKREERRRRNLLEGKQSQSQSASVSSTARASPSTPATSIEEAEPIPSIPTLKNGSLQTDKSGYEEHPDLSNLSQSEIDTYLTTHSINVSDTSTLPSKLRPITSFSHLPSPNDPLFKPLKAFSAPTPIQAAAWPFLFSGRDVVGIAETGSGKTLAFGVPCIRRLTSRDSKNGKKRLRAVMIAPTRELAIQVHKQMVEIAGDLAGKVACVYGGVSKDEQRIALKSAVIVVATPGRLKDLIGEGMADFKSVEYLVLDEADRMLDKGFEQDIKEIISSMPGVKSRQTLMFTATWPTSVQELAANFMNSPVRINIGDSPSSDLRANPRIKQIVEVIDQRDKDYRLMQLLNDHHRKGGNNDKILVFCLYKKEAARVERFMRSKGFQVAGIHGDMNQTERIKSLDAFRSGQVPLLVATDVAARGLDIPAVKLVLNVTFPLTVEDYVHRIGR